MTDRVKKRTRSSLKNLVILLIVLIDVYPLFWLITSSFKSPNEFVIKPAYALNAGFYIQNYVEAWTRGNMATFLTNSLICTVVSLVVIIILTVPCSFALTKMNWKGQKLFDRYFGFGIMIPVATCLIPLFQIFKGMDLINTRQCLIIIYSASGVSFSLYLLESSMKTLPDELLEASVIDGCGIFTMLYRIVLPLSKNSIITVLVIQFFFKWNDLLYSQTFISSTKLKTIQTGLLYFENEFGVKDWGAIFASISICVIPLLIMYLFLNKSVIEGMTAGAVKG